MPTKRTRISRSRARKLEPLEWTILTDRHPPEDADAHAIFEVGLHAEELWREHGESILATWPPGTRPSLWWRFEAPRLAIIPERFRGCWFAKDLIEPRLLLAGAGRPLWEVESLVPRYRLGIPTLWHGFCPTAPLEFETQGAYLARHGLLRPGEVGEP